MARMLSWGMDPTFPPTTAPDPGLVWRLAWRLRSPAARRALFQDLLLGQGRILSVHEREARMRVLLRQGLGKEQGFTEDPGQGQTLAAATMAAAGMSDDQPELLALALQAGVDVNHRQKDGWLDTLLTRAVRCGRVQNVRVLMQHGSDPTLIEGSGYGALNLAIQNDGNTNDGMVCVMTELLLQEGADANHCGRRAKGDEKVRLHLQIPPLLLAVNRGRIDVAKILMDAGANPHAMDPMGRSAVHHAKSIADLDAVVAMGCDLHATDPTGVNVLMQAVHGGGYAMALALMQRGLDARGRWMGYHNDINLRACGDGAGILHRLVLAGPLPGADALIDAIEIRHPDCWTWANTAGETPLAMLERRIREGNPVDDWGLARAGAGLMETHTAPTILAHKPRMRL